MLVFDQRDHKATLMKKSSSVIVVLVALLCMVAKTCTAQVFDEQFEHWPVDLKINGQVIVAGELDDLAALAKFFKVSDREKRVAVVATPLSDGIKSSLIELFSKTESLEFSDLPTTPKDVETLLSNHDVVVWYSAKPLNESFVSVVREAKKSFTNFLNDAKTLVVLGGASEIVAQSYFKSEDTHPPVLWGLNLLPDCVLETNFDGAEDQDRLLSILKDQPRSIGVGLDKNTALILSGRKFRVAGQGGATFILQGNDREPPRIQKITSAERRVRNLEGVLLDLTQWRRDAIDRTLPEFPSENPRKPFVKNGTLIIVGGGGTPRGLMGQMIEFAGGVDEAKLVYVPCSEQENVGQRQSMVQRWKKAGVKHATFIHSKDRNQANSDAKFLKPLNNATGIYFGGGRQWNFSDSYYGTTAHKLMKEVLDRGGVIAGSSAGASIQGRYLARATPIGNSKIMAFGYERGGLGFLDGVAIDQHFSQRRRHNDMSQLVKRYPQLLGIGIDESTAIIVQRSNAKVVGRGKVHFYDRNMHLVTGQPDYVALPAGSEYDLTQRKVLKDTRKDSPSKQLQSVD